MMLRLLHSDRRVSAPEYLFASTGGFNIATSDSQPTYSSTGSHYVLEKPEVRPAGFCHPDLSQWQPNSAELQPHFRRLHRASINYPAQNVNLVAARRGKLKLRDGVDLEFED